MANSYLDSAIQLKAKEWFKVDAKISIMALTPLPPNVIMILIFGSAPKLPHTWSVP
jgi:hypothetical protein